LFVRRLLAARDLGDLCGPDDWPALREAVLHGSETNSANFLADFPLINKSFNLSYSGHDL
jgi:hypothetical protein